MIVPENLSFSEKRSLVRFHLSQGSSVVIAGIHGLRDPRPDEITTPEKVLPSKDQKRKQN